MLGKVIDSSVIQKKLIELNPDFSFDVMNKLEACRPVLEIGFKKLNTLRQGVYYNGAHVCSMDRGLVPEYPTFTVVKRRVEVDASQADDPDTTTQFQTFKPFRDGYLAACLHVENNDPGWVLRPDMAIVRYTWFKIVKAQGPKEFLGWRPTLLKILHRGIPGVTLRSLGEKFGTDMAILPSPGASPYELHRTFVEE